MSKKESEKPLNKQVNRQKRATLTQSPKSVFNKASSRHLPQAAPKKKNMERVPQNTVHESNIVQFPTRTSTVTQQTAKSKKTARKKEPKQPKRVTHKMARQRRIIKQVITAIMSFILVAVCVFMSLKLLFIVRTIEVTGSELFSAEDITAFCAIPIESNIFTVKTKELEKRISEEFTYIENVRVQKKLPDKISITITDSVESYYTLTDEKIGIYSQSFKFLRTGDTIPSDMLCLDFDMQNVELTDIANQLLALFKLYEIEGITVLTIPNTSNVRAVYEDRLEVEFGTMLDIEYKIKMLKKVISENKIPAEESGTLDATKGGEIVYKRH